MTEQTVNLEFRYQPREYQLPFQMAFPYVKKRACLIWHRRGGKDLSIFNKLWTCALQDTPGAYYYFFPTYAQGKKILWDGRDKAGVKYRDYIPAGAIAVDPVTKRPKVNETEMQIELYNGSIIQIIGTDKLNSIVGTNPLGVVFSEYSLQNPRAWDFVRPILRENGGWAAFATTPRGRNHAYRLYNMARQNPAWFCQLLTVNDTKRPDGTPVISPSMIDEDRAEGMDEDMVQQEYYCSFEGSVHGSYFGRLLSAARANGRVGDFVWNKALPVYTAWDIGIGDAAVCIFYQRVGPYLHIIDVEEESGLGVEDWADKVYAKPYGYGWHYGPHDLAKREFGSGKTIKAMASKAGLHFGIVPRITDKEDAIAAVRKIFPRLRFHQKTCEDKLFGRFSIGDEGEDRSGGHSFMDAVAFYHKEWDEDNECFKDAPAHDWSSHPVDALMTLACAEKDSGTQRIQTRVEARFDPLSTEHLAEAYERGGDFVEEAV